MHGKHISYKTQKPIYRLMRVEVENQQFAFVIKKTTVGLKAFPQLKSGYFYSALTGDEQITRISYHFKSIF